MAQEAKFSITFKPRLFDRVPLAGATDLVAAEYYLIFTTEAILNYIENLGLVARPNTAPGIMRNELVYSSPLRIGEEMKISVRTTRLGTSSWSLEHQLNEASTGRSIATVTETRVWVDLQAGRSVPWDEESKRKIIDFEGKDNVEVVSK
jgi:acyl-CoA thioesterase FadM